MRFVNQVYKEAIGDLEQLFSVDLDDFGKVFTIDLVKNRFY